MLRICVFFPAGQVRWSERNSDEGIPRFAFRPCFVKIPCTPIFQKPMNTHHKLSAISRALVSHVRFSEPPEPRRGHGLKNVPKPLTKGSILGQCDTVLDVTPSILSLICLPFNKRGYPFPCRLLIGGCRHRQKESSQREGMRLEANVPKQD